MWELTLLLLLRRTAIFIWSAVPAKRRTPWRYGYRARRSSSLGDAVYFTQRRSLTGKHASFLLSDGPNLAPASLALPRTSIVDRSLERLSPRPRSARSASPRRPRRWPRSPSAQRRPISVKSHGPRLARRTPKFSAPFAVHFTGWVARRSRPFRRPSGSRARTSRDALPDELRTRRAPRCAAGSRAPTPRSWHRTGFAGR